MAVSSLVLEFGGSEDQAIAALLHDTIEDCGLTRKDLELRFGGAVAQIVAECSDSETTSKPPWRERKQRYLEHLGTVHAETLLVSACDKLHNARAIVGDVRMFGDTVWSRFSAKPEDILWYYESLLRIYQSSTSMKVLPGKLVIELDAAVSQMRSLVVPY